MKSILMFIFIYLTVAKKSFISATACNVPSHVSNH